MSEFKATEKQWAEVLFWSSKDSGGSACILELRDRIERLELGAGIHAAVKNEITNAYPVRSGHSLVRQVASAMARADDDFDCDTEAAAAIREVAEWLRNSRMQYAETFADLLEQEASR
jgi:hypothetical protein